MSARSNAIRALGSTLAFKEVKLAKLDFSAPSAAYIRAEIAALKFAIAEIERNKGGPLP